MPVLRIEAFGAGCGFRYRREANGIARRVGSFVRGAQATDGETAKHAFIALAILMAPKTLIAIDAEDLLAVPGPAHAPPALAQAIWLREGEGRLMFLSSADQLAVSDAKYVVVNTEHI